MHPICYLPLNSLTVHQDLVGSEPRILYASFYLYYLSYIYTKLYEISQCFQYKFEGYYFMI